MRYYYQRGQLIESLRHDVAVDSAVNILHDEAKYKKTLKPAKKDADNK